MNFEAYLHYQEKHRLFLEEEEERILAEKAKRSSHLLNPRHNPLVNPEPTEQTGTPLASRQAKPSMRPPRKAKPKPPNNTNSDANEAHPR